MVCGGIEGRLFLIVIAGYGCSLEDVDRPQSPGRRVPDVGEPVPQIRSTASSASSTAVT